MLTKPKTYCYRFSRSTKPAKALETAVEELKQEAPTLRNVAVNLWKYGDPDGNGDLVRTRQYAFVFTPVAQEDMPV